MNTYMLRLGDKHSTPNDNTYYINAKTPYEAVEQLQNDFIQKYGRAMPDGKIHVEDEI